MNTEHNPLPVLLGRDTNVELITDVATNYPIGLRFIDPNINNEVTLNIVGLGGLTHYAQGLVLYLNQLEMVAKFDSNNKALEQLTSTVSTAISSIAET